jgi:hypothetical protein
MRLQIADFRLQSAEASLSLRALRVLRAFVMSCGWLLGALLIMAPTGASGEIIDRVLAVVAGQLITLSDVTAARELGLERADGAPDPIRAILSKLIDRELILAEVDRYAPPEPSAAAVSDGVAEVRARFPSPAAFDAALARSGIDERHLRETLRQGLRMRAYIVQRFPAAGDRRESSIEEWVSGLRSRADVVDLYLGGR